MRLEGGRWKDYFPTKQELYSVRKKISDAIHASKLNKKLGEFYQTNNPTTPISVVADAVGVHRSTLYKKITNPFQFSRNPHRPHPLGITEEYWRSNYDSGIGVRGNMRKMGISQSTYYNAYDRWEVGRREVGGGGKVGGE